MKIVINSRHGGFDLSDAALLKYLDLAGIEYVEEDSGYGWSNIKVHDVHFYASDIARDDTDLVTVVEEMGEEACGSYACLKVVEIPDGVEWQIDEYDGLEWVAEAHRTWC